MDILETILKYLLYYFIGGITACFFIIDIPEHFKTKRERKLRRAEERGTLKCCIQDIEEKIEAGDQYQ